MERGRIYSGRSAHPSRCNEAPRPGREVRRRVEVAGALASTRVRAAPRADAAQRFDRPIEPARRLVHPAVRRHNAIPRGYRGKASCGWRQAGRDSAVGPVSGWPGFCDASLPAGIDLDALV